MRKIITIIIILCLLVIENFSQDCIQELKGTINGLMELYDENNFETLKMTYTITQEFVNGEKKVINFEFYTDGNKNYLLSDDYQMISDTLVTIGVNNVNEGIFIGSSLPKRMRENNLKRILNNQLKELDQLEDVTCSSTDIDGVPSTIIRANANKYFKDYTGIGSVEIVVDRNKNQIVSIEQFYPKPNNSMIRTILEIKEVVTNEKFKELEIEPADYVMGEDGQLMEAYKNFELNELDKVKVNDTLEN